VASPLAPSQPAPSQPSAAQALNSQPPSPAPPADARRVVAYSAQPSTTGTAAPARSEPTHPAVASSAPIHARGGWLIQIGAFGGEDEARQHLSDAQIKLEDTLAAADPFTERVQKGDKTFFRARFAGFDKETAEAACRLLKRNDFECMALKD